MNKVIRLSLFLNILLCSFIISFAGIQSENRHVVINPTCEQQRFDGFGTSLCWWANIAGNWSDEKIDTIVDWLVSPEGLNYRVFRYNIGGGDDPENNHCTPHHMANGQGPRAEMEGFKDSPDGPYIWTRDAAQRKIMLKIKEKRPDAIFEAFSNSCPWWMTYSGCSSGNIVGTEDNLRPEYYQDFANYLIDVCRHYKDEYGIEFKTIEPFNEAEGVGWAANGGQEGCSFSIASQIEFIKILAQVISQSGLNIEIAAPDVSHSDLYKPDFEAYENAGIIDLVGKWNVHTYSVTTPHRTQLDMLCRQHDIPLWVSETGPLWPSDVPTEKRKGIAGNLTMAQWLIDDIRYLRPSAWLDWQYMDKGVQWSLVGNDNFSEESIHKIKNYYVRSHFSRFIKDNYTFVTTLNENTLAAHNPGRDELVLVTVNGDTIPVNYTADLTMYGGIGEDILGYITTESEDMSAFGNFRLEDKTLHYTIPGKSIITYTIPVNISQGSSPELENGTYMIYPRVAEGLVWESSDSSVHLSPLAVKPEQKWIMSVSENGVMLEDMNHQIVTKSESGALRLQGEEDLVNQRLQICHMDGHYYKISMFGNDNEYLKIGKYSPTTNTKLLFDSIVSTTPTDYHWGIIQILPSSGSTDHIPNIKKGNIVKIDTSVKGAVTIKKESGTHGIIRIHSINGQCVYSTRLNHDIVVPLLPGMYIVEFEDGNYKQAEKIVVR